MSAPVSQMRMHTFEEWEGLGRVDAEGGAVKV